MENINNFYKVLGALLIAACVFVPYTVVLCNGRGACQVNETGYAFVGALPQYAQINTAMLVIEIMVILVIAFGFRFLEKK